MPNLIFFCPLRFVSAENGLQTGTAGRHLIQLLRKFEAWLLLTKLSQFGFCGGAQAGARSKAMPISNQTRPAGKRTRNAFSLVELLAVMAIMVLLLALLGPAIKGFSSTAGRKGAINVLMNTFEQARAAALETGANVYVVLWKREFPAQDSIMVIRDPLEWNQKEAGFIPLTRWVQLPKGVLLYDPPKVSKNLFKALPSDFDVSGIPKSGGETPARKNLAIIKFSPTGTIQIPANKDDCRLMIGEGFRGSDGNETLINAKKDAGLFDVITFRRFTGRASLDVSTLSSL